jgi:hypothetical protein
MHMPVKIKRFIVDPLSSEFFFATAGGRIM